MPNQLRFNHQHSSIQGSIFFSSKSVTQNLGGFQDSLRYNFYRNIALVPAMPWKDDKAPEAPQQLRYQAKNKQAELSWLAPKGEAPTYYAIYRFEESARANTENPDYLLAVTRRLDFVDGSAEVGKTYRYVVTALDRLHNESKPQQVRGQLE
jgi:hypothetical protein